jgi:hypothetical protein
MNGEKGDPIVAHSCLSDVMARRCEPGRKTSGPFYVTEITQR